MTDLVEMNKGELQAYAKGTFGVDLDMRKSLDTLLAEVGKLEAPKAQPKAIQPEAPKATHLLNKATGLWFMHTSALVKRGDLVPCDEEGNPV